MVRSTRWRAIAWVGGFGALTAACSGLNPAFDPDGGGGADGAGGSGVSTSGGRPNPDPAGATGKDSHADDRGSSGGPADTGPTTNDDDAGDHDGPADSTDDGTDDSPVGETTGPQPCELGAICTLETGCGGGERCVPLAADGGPGWDALHCVPDGGDGGEGDACTFSCPTDDCAPGLVCTFSAVDDETGVCVRLCSDRGAQTCDGASACQIVLPGAGLCLPESCDPIMQDCFAGWGCYPSVDGATFACFPVATEGAPGDACGFANQCAPGTVCSGFADCGGESCCVQLCELPSSCADASPCLDPWEGDPPVGYEMVGYCAPP